MIFDNKVVEAFKSMGVNKHCQDLINAYREEIYNREVDDVRQFFIDNVDLSKGISEAVVDMNHFTSFVRANYFKVDKLKFIEKEYNFYAHFEIFLYSFKDENKNLYDIKIYYNSFFCKGYFHSIYSYKNDKSHRDYRKPSIVEYRENGSIYAERYFTS